MGNYVILWKLTLDKVEIVSIFIVYDKVCSIKITNDIWGDIMGNWGKYFGKLLVNKGVVKNI